MNKNAIQRFAIWARTELIAQVSQRAYQYDITADGCGDDNAVAVGGRLLTDAEKKQRRELIDQIRSKGYAQVMEEVAYTWFNRFIALRFMEVNNYLPTHVRVFSDASGAFKPEILSAVLHLDLDGLDMEKVSELIEKTQTEDLYRYLLLTQCNALSPALPRMFETMDSYTELLLPNNILRPDGILGRLVTDIPEEDWTDQVQIIGWLYQYYNTELKNETFSLLKKNVKITKERLPSATQLFTPDWIVRYMVENSLGRLWIEGHPDDELKAGWKYYLEEAEQEPEVQKQLEAIRAEYRTLRPQDIKVIDPCMGSGHILVYCFDVLVQIYKKAGYSERDAAQSILENNLYGLDIDDRAAQLAYFAVMMKARQYDRRIFTRNIQPHVYAIEESNGIRLPGKELLGPVRKIAERLIQELKDAKEYGSILNLSLTIEELAALRGRLKEIDEKSHEGTIADTAETKALCDSLLPLVDVAEALVRKYDVVVTNPPYAGAKGLNPKLRDFINSTYVYGKYDIFAAFLIRCIYFMSLRGKFSLITPNTLLYNPSYTKLRKQIVSQINFTTMTELGSDAFEVGFDTVVYSGQNKGDLNGYNGHYYDVTNDPEKRFRDSHEYISSTDYFADYGNCKFMYKLNEHYRTVISNSKKLGHIGCPRIGMQTNDNQRFIREWFEVNYLNFYPHHNRTEDFPDAKWFPIAKGGGYRKWYGNIMSVVNWEKNGYAIKQANIGAAGGRIVSEEYYFLEGLTWTHTTYSQPYSIRYMPAGILINVEGPAIFELNENKWYVLACLNSVVADDVFEKVVSSIHYSASELAQFPIILKQNTSIDNITQECVVLSKLDWDSFETSWDFKIHPMVPVYADEPDYAYSVQAFYNGWKSRCQTRFDKLKANEEELNRIFIDIYGLQDELTPEVADRDVTVRLADLGRDIRSLISYAVGCMFGRYSANGPVGLIYAGGEWDPEAYGRFKPDEDNIIPICDDEYFDDDIVGRFVQWLEIVYGKRSLEENLKFIADALGGKGSPRDVIRNYFLNDFYADHLKVYQKRPIYWLFDSGKKNGFKALIYMHRYQSDLLARMRTDYVHEQQERYRTQLKHIGDAIDSASATERVKLAKQQKKLQEQALELQKYEEKIHHLADQNIEIDLDDGVKVNYAKFADVLAKIK